MSTERRYPECTEGPFDRPPATHVDAEGREIRIDLAETDDIAELVAMYADFDPAQRAQGIPPADPDRIEPWIRTVLEDGIHLVARHAEHIVGHAMVVPDADGAHELAIFVHQAYQGAGNGRRLIEHLLGEAGASNAGRIWLTVERWNIPAIELYRSVGFETVQADRFDIEMAMHLDT